MLTNKYAEGYPNARYYQGCGFYDQIETLAIDRAKQLFGCQFANVQPHSGAQANGAVFLAMLNPGDVFASLVLPDGGHLSHGRKVNMSGKWFNPVHYPLVYELGLSRFRTDRLRRRPQSLPRAQAQTPSLRIFAPIRASSTSPNSAPSPMNAAHW